MPSGWLGVCESSFAAASSLSLIHISIPPRIPGEKAEKRGQARANGPSGDKGHGIGALQHFGSGVVRYDHGQEKGKNVDARAKGRAAANG